MPIGAVAKAVAAPVLGGIANSLFGGHGKNEAQLPPDLQGMRANQIQLLNYLTGFGGMPGAMGGAIPGMPGNPAGAMRWIGQYGQEAKRRQGQGMPGDPKHGWGPASESGYGQALGQYNYADGGMAYGPGGPKDDKIKAKLSNGEGVLTAETVHALGGPPIVHFLNLIGAMQQQQLERQIGIDLGQGATLHGNQLLLGGREPIEGKAHFANGGVAGQPYMQLQTLGQQFPQFANARMPAMDPTRTGGLPQLPAGGMGAGMPGAGGPPSPDARLKSPAQQRLESYFGQLGIPTTALQRQSVGGMQQFLASDPYGQARTALNGILGDPGAAYRTDFERALAQANQSGGRFGSANALMRSTALNDYNSAALKNQLGAAQGIGQLGAQQVADLTGGYNMGQSYGNQLASGQQQAIQMLPQQLGTAQSATLGAPVQQQPSGFGQFMQGFGGVAQLLPFLQSGGGGSSSGPGYQNTNWIYNR